MANIWNTMKRCIKEDKLVNNVIKILKKVLTKHNCYVIILVVKQELVRFSPSGTAEVV